jgi:putative thioredoxin
MAQSPYIFEVTAQDFSGRVLDASKDLPVLVDFWAAWCAPCRVLMPIVAKLADEYQGLFLLAKVNTDQEQSLAVEYGVRSLPTLKVFKDGQVVDEIMGAQPEPVIRQLIEQHIVRESDRLRAEAQMAQERGNAEEAVRLLRKAVEIDPGNRRATIDLANRLVDVGAVEEAEGIAEGLPREIREQPEGNALRTRIELARVVREAPAEDHLLATIVREPHDSEARYQLSARYLQRGDYERALEQLIEIVRRDRGFGDDAGRRGMLAIFDALGNSGELVSRYRRMMASALR